ncbi:TFIID-18kDa-domain-containing protein [Bimuria novae-zelandiae CBS 107.79]|uniref:Transcription initiation factor TFIID subunit 13 n=1 Tax=Bimuria novae-zelandiae CBS 107.79 TaxID=1447943 RepID=A0A6A5UUJ1_9PLEO|nr:TFIID-18kDa-domain-containing protein [Bimuria novae-zelandiae CBS 107.79]
MTEPRMRQRGKGPQWEQRDLESFLVAYGDTSRPPLRSTVLTLDEIITDYIIETCHEAAAVASHARRQKIKLDDFKFMLRRDTAKLGRVSELLETDKELKMKRKTINLDEGNVVRSVEEEAGVGKKKRKEAVDEEGDEEGERRRKKKKGKKEDAGTVVSG